jgi:hypothetical protein
MTYYRKKAGDVEKLWINNVVQSLAALCLKNDSKKKNAFVLDDHNFQSTKSIINKNISVYLAQNDKNTYNKMLKNKPENATVHFGDYKMLNDMKIKNVVIDHADFCSTASEKVYETLRERFVKGMYADTAILRITVCQRGIKKDEFINLLLTDLTEYVKNTPYMLKPLSIRNWCNLYGEEYKMNFHEEDLDNTIYHTGTSMYTMICLIQKSKLLELL